MQLSSPLWGLTAGQGGDRTPALSVTSFVFCPSNLTAPNESRHPTLCHPERTRISYFTALPAATYAALRKESRMKPTEATFLTGNLGEPRDLRCAPAPPQKLGFASSQVGTKVNVYNSFES
jgi:hypothetical protein